MASVNFSNGKLKGATHAKAIFMHCDKEKRLQGKQANEDINKAETHLNTDIKGLDYEQLCAAYNKRIRDIDGSGDNTNKRKDRVTCFSLDIPMPENLSDDKADAWFGRVADILNDQYGEKNFLDMKIHKDEVHEYVDAQTKEKRISRIHAHAFIVPEHEGGLNGKWFSSRSNMKKLNNEIHEMSEKEFNCQFMDGTKKKSVDKVEQLKNKSLKAENELLKQEQARLQADIKMLEAQQETLKRDKEKIKEEWEKISEERKQLISAKQQANKQTAYAKQKITEWRDQFKESLTEIIKTNDDYHNGLIDKKYAAENLGMTQLTKVEQEQLKFSKPVRSKFMATGKQTLKDANDELEML